MPIHKTRQGASAIKHGVIDCRPWHRQCGFALRVLGPQEVHGGTRQQMASRRLPGGNARINQENMFARRRKT